jgi:transposase
LERHLEDLMSTNKEVDQSIRPLLKLSREMIERGQKLDYALVSSLERDPLLAERLQRLRTVPGVGPITALTWALEIGNYTGFQSIKDAISYCGLCGDEKSSADEVLRMPLSKKRNKHIQPTLIEAAKRAFPFNHALGVAKERVIGRSIRERSPTASLINTWTACGTRQSGRPGVSVLHIPPLRLFGRDILATASPDCLAMAITTS